jgi:hypothetical protein
VVDAPPGCAAAGMRRRSDASPLRRQLGRPEGCGKTYQRSPSRPLLFHETERDYVAAVDPYERARLLRRLARAVAIDMIGWCLNREVIPEVIHDGFVEQDTVMVTELIFEPTPSCKAHGAFGAMVRRRQHNRLAA